MWDCLTNDNEKDLLVNQLTVFVLNIFGHDENIDGEFNTE